MTPSIPIFRNEINELEDFRGGAKVAHDFADWDVNLWEHLIITGREDQSITYWTLSRAALAR